MAKKSLYINGINTDDLIPVPTGNGVLRRNESDTAYEWADLSPSSAEDGYIAIAQGGDITWLNADTDGYVLTWNSTLNSWQPQPTQGVGGEETLAETLAFGNTADGINIDLNGGAQLTSSDGNVTVGDNLDVTGNAAITGNTNVTGDGYVLGNFEVAGKLVLDANTDFNNAGYRDVLAVNQAGTALEYISPAEFLGLEQETIPVTINGQQAFILSEIPVGDGYVMMFVNGMKQQYGVDYVGVGTSIMYSDTDLITADVVEFFYHTFTTATAPPGGMQTLADTLLLGNVTGGTDIVLSSGDAITNTLGSTLDINTLSNAVGTSNNIDIFTGNALGDSGNINLTTGIAGGTRGIVNIDGDGYVLGDFGISGKLTVDGLIDPTGLVLTEQAVAPYSPLVGGSTEGMLWVRNDGYMFHTNQDDTTIALDTILSSAAGSINADTITSNLNGEFINVDLPNIELRYDDGEGFFLQGFAFVARDAGSVGNANVTAFTTSGTGVGPLTVFLSPVSPGNSAITGLTGGTGFIVGDTVEITEVDHGTGPIAVGPLTAVYSKRGGTSRIGTNSKILSGDVGPNMTLLGGGAGNNLAPGSTGSVILGNAGEGLTGAFSSVLIGNDTGPQGGSVFGAVMIGDKAGGGSFPSIGEIFIGQFAGYGASTIGGIALGTQAMGSGVIGNNHIAIGLQAMGGPEISGISNIAIGTQAMGGGRITGNDNIAIGSQSMGSPLGDINNAITIGRVSNIISGNSFVNIGDEFVVNRDSTSVNSTGNTYIGIGDVGSVGVNNLTNRALVNFTTKPDQFTTNDSTPYFFVNGENAYNIYAGFRPNPGVNNSIQNISYSNNGIYDSTVNVGGSFALADGSYTVNAYTSSGTGTGILYVKIASNAVIKVTGGSNFAVSETVNITSILDDNGSPIAGAPAADLSVSVLTIEGYYGGSGLRVVEAKYSTDSTSGFGKIYSNAINGRFVGGGNFELGDTIEIFSIGENQATTNGINSVSITNGGILNWSSVQTGDFNLIPGRYDVTAYSTTGSGTGTLTAEIDGIGRISKLYGGDNFGSETVTVTEIDGVPSDEDGVFNITSTGVGTFDVTDGLKQVTAYTTSGSGTGTIFVNMFNRHIAGLQVGGQGFAALDTITITEIEGVPVQNASGTITVTSITATGGATRTRAYITEIQDDNIISASAGDMYFSPSGISINTDGSTGWEIQGDQPHLVIGTSPTDLQDGIAGGVNAFGTGVNDPIPDALIGSVVFGNDACSGSQFPVGFSVLIGDQAGPQNNGNGPGFMSLGPWSTVIGYQSGQGISNSVGFGQTYLGANTGPQTLGTNVGFNNVAIGRDTFTESSGLSQEIIGIGFNNLKDPRIGPNTIAIGSNILSAPEIIGNGAVTGVSVGTGGTVANPDGNYIVNPGDYTDTIDGRALVLNVTVTGGTVTGVSVNFPDVGYAYNPGDIIAINQINGLAVTVSPVININSTQAVSNEKNIIIGSGAMSNIGQAGDTYSAVSNNIVIGNDAAANLQDISPALALQNIIIGNSAAENATLGGGPSVIIGDLAGQNASIFGTTNFNAIVGYQAAQNATSLDSCVVFGSGAVRLSTGISYGTFLGHGTGTNASGERTVVVGWLAGSQAGSRSVIMGAEAAVSGPNNDSVIIGYQAGNGITIGFENVIIGGNAADLLTEGSNNTLIGKSIAPSLTTGSGNTAVGGSSTLDAITTQSGNVALGDGAGTGFTGSGTILIGGGSGSGGSTTSGLFIGAGAGSGASDSNQVAIGNGTIVTGNDSVALGTAAAVSGGAGVAVGTASSAADTSVAVGFTASAAGSSGIAIGPAANAGTGGTNTVIGFLAGSGALSGSNNLLIGNASNTLTGASNDNVIIGNIPFVSIPTAPISDYINLAGVIKGSLAAGPGNAVAAIGGPAAYDPTSQAETLYVFGDGYVEGDFGISGKLSVDGLIDPTGMVFVNQSSVPGGTPATGETTLWVRDSDGYAILTDEFGNDNVLGQGGGGGGGSQDLESVLINGDTTRGNDIVISTGDAITTETDGSSLTVQTREAAGVNGDFYISSGDFATAGNAKMQLTPTSTQIEAAFETDIQIRSGGANGTSSGNVTIQSYAAGGSGVGSGGQISLDAGDASGGNFAGGTIQITSGNGSGTGVAGAINLTAGNGDGVSTGIGGAVNIAGGTSQTVGGSVTLTSGEGETFGGNLVLTAGNSDNGNAGDLIFAAGDTVNGSGGAVSITSGAVTGAGTDSDIDITTGGAGQIHLDALTNGLGSVQVDGNIINIASLATATITGANTTMSATGTVLLSGSTANITSSGVGGLAITAGGAGDLTLDNGVPFVWPTADGSNGQVLTTDGSGNLSFASSGGGLTAPANPAEDGYVPIASGGDLTYLRGDADGDVLAWNESAETWESQTLSANLGTNITGNVQTTDATQTTLATFSANTNDTIYSFRAEVTGIQAGANGAGYEIKGTFKRIGGTVTQIGSTLVVYAHEDDSTWGGVTFDISGSDIRVRVTGLAATTIDWQCFGNIKVGS